MPCLSFYDHKATRKRLDLLTAVPTFQFMTKAILIYTRALPGKVNHILARHKQYTRAAVNLSYLNVVASKDF
jgi:hypothetical protein